MRSAVESELRSLGLQVAEQASPHIDIRVTLSENLDSYIWVAEFARGETPAALIVALARDASSRRASTPSSLVLRKELVWEQTQPILDVAFSSPHVSSPILLVLEPSRLAVYKPERESWRLEQSYPLSSLAGRLRNPRGRLIISPDEVRVSMEGSQCEEILIPAQRTECQDRKFSWSAPGENAAGSGPKSPGSYSFASLSESGQRWIMVAGSDELARLYAPDGKVAATFSGWGSDLAGLETSCGTGHQFLVTRPGDWTQPDSIQGYEITNGQAVAVTPPFEFPGPITALWTSSNTQSAVAVVSDFSVGRYEAYRISITCGR